MNCENACPEDVIKFTFLPNRRSTITQPDTGRRTALASVGAGALFLPASRIADTLDVNYASKVIRPPGSVEERAFLERCIRCAECMKVCPNNALHPAFFEKMGVGQAPIKIGTAFYDHGRCLPWSMQTPCIVCEEFCPTSPKSIWVEEVDVVVRESTPGPDGAPPAFKTVHLQRPHVDPSLCVGCGACEKVCPVQDQPAVYVTSVGETRSKTNVILLENTAYKQTS
jgi:ferredoxin